jgi:hypothetical protein
MRFRFGAGEELAFVSDVLPQLLSDVGEGTCGRCPSPSSVDSPRKYYPAAWELRDSEVRASKPAATWRSRLQSKRKIERLRREIATLGLELARLSETDNSKQNAVRSRWQSIAEARLEQRQQAESDNRKLKRMITAQHVLAKSIINGQVERLRARSKARRALLSSRTSHTNLYL